MENLEACIIEIKKAIARIEEQTRTIFKNLAEFKASSERLHAEHFDAANSLRKEASEMYRHLDVRVSRHGVDIVGIQRSLAKMEKLLQEIAQGSARTRGIAMGLGMAGGAVVSILTLLAQLMR
jgi:chromosome segregation ATPase